MTYWLTYFLGLEFLYTDKGILMHQRKYTIDMVKWFKMMDCNHIITHSELNSRKEETKDEEKMDHTHYKQLIGSVRYHCNSRLDLSFVVGVASRHMHEPRKSHLIAAKRILIYLKGAKDLGILFQKNKNEKMDELIGYCDSDWCDNKSERMSTTGYLFKLARALISWCSKKQPVVALSSLK